MVVAAFPWLGFGLGLLAAWVVAAIVIALLSRRAERLAIHPPLACFRADPEHADTARLAFLGDVQRGISDVAPSLPGILASWKSQLLVSVA